MAVAKSDPQYNFKVEKAFPNFTLEFTPWSMLQELYIQFL
jgi:hypothetical protein